MADDKIIIGIGIDDKEVEQWAKDAEKTLSGAGQKVNKSFSDAFKVDGLADLTAGLYLAKEAANVAIGFVKKLGEEIFNLALQGENLKNIEKSFDIIGSQAGLATESLKDNIISATGGFVDATDAIEASSQAILKLGANADRLPQIFQLSQQVSKVFGKDIIEVFDNISSAIATGNTRTIKQLGLIIDTNKVYNDLAKSLNINVNLLNEEQKQQALLNAVLEKGSTSFKGIAISVDSLGGSYKQLKASTSDLGDTTATIFNNIFGAAFTLAIQKSKDNIDEFNLSLKQSSGIKLSIDEQIKLLNLELQKQNDLIAIRARSGMLDQYNEETTAIKNQIAALQQKKAAQEEADFMRAAKKQATGVEKPTGALDTAQLKAQADAALKLQTQYQADSLALKQQSLADDIAVANKIQDEKLKNQELDRLALQQEALDLEASLIKQAEIKQKYTIDGVFKEKEANALIELEKQRHQDAIEKIKAESEARQLAKTKSFQEASRQIIVGGLVSTITNVTNALLKGENAFKAFAGGVLSMFGDLAIQLGTFYIAEGIAKMSLFGPGTGSITAGASLIALGAVLKSFFGGAGSAATGGVPSTGGATVPGAASDTTTQEQIQEKTTQVKIDVQGTVLSPIEVGKQIAEILNDTFSATGTKVVTA